MKSKRGKNNSSIDSLSFLPRILGMGNFELTYTLTLSDDEILRFQLDFEKLDSIDKISFITEAQYLWDKIFISASTFTLNLLLFINRVSDNKVYIEYIPFQMPYFSDKEQKFKKMFQDTNELNYLFFNESDICGAGKPFTLILKYGDKEKKFTIGTGSKPQQTQPQQQQNTTATPAQGKGNPPAKQQPAKNAPPAKGSAPAKNAAPAKGNAPAQQQQQQQQPKKEEKEKIVSKDGSVYNKIKFSCKQYDYLFVNIDELSKLSPFDEFVEFITYMKMKCNSNIVIRYTEISESDMNIINKLYLLTDTFILTLKAAVGNFNKHFQHFSTNKKQTKEINEKNVIDYFITTIACGGQLSLMSSKLAFITDEIFSKISIVEVPMGVRSTTLNYEIKPYPKISPSNVKLVQLYKDCIKNNREFLEGVFYGGVASKISFCRNKNKGFEYLYPSYLCGSEILKRIVDLEVKEVPLPSENKFYIVKLDKGEIENEIKKRALEKKEGKFVLDCTNAEKSKMKYYVPLFDYNLHEYFKSDVVQKDLKEKGFINSKGFVNYDPLYGREMYKAVQKSKGPKVNAKEIINKQIKENESNQKRKILRSVQPTNRRLPIENCETTNKIQKMKCIHKKDPKNPNKQCKFCELKKQSIIAETIEEEKRKQMQLRRYDKE